MALIGVFDRSPDWRELLDSTRQGSVTPFWGIRVYLKSHQLREEQKKLVSWAEHRELVEKRFELMDRCTHRRDFKCARDDDGNGWSQKLA